MILDTGKFGLGHLGECDVAGLDETLYCNFVFYSPPLLEVVLTITTRGVAIICIGVQGTQVYNYQGPQRHQTILVLTFLLKQSPITFTEQLPLI